MNDKSMTKIICRIINLITYIFMLTSCILLFYFELYGDMKIFEWIFDNRIKPIVICAVPLIVMMIICIVVKYTYKEESKVQPYRVIYTISMIICVLPITYIGTYALIQWLSFDTIINTIISIAIFYIVNKILKWAFQESLEVSFLTNDNL